jgi:tetratricopeptide (TPR) repeat protein
MGQLDEALTALERAHKYHPKHWYILIPLSVVYANLGRTEEARSTLGPLIKTWTKRGRAWHNLRFHMYWYPFKDREVEKAFANGLIKAGLPGQPDEYYKGYQEKKLTGEEIKDLIFAQTVTGFDIITGKQWWVERTKSGKATYCGPKGYVKGEVSELEETSDNGKSWIESDRICNQWKNLFGGLEDCQSIYENPEGTPEKKDEYIGMAGYGPVPFSLVD